MGKASYLAAALILLGGLLSGCRDVPSQEIFSGSSPEELSDESRTRLDSPGPEGAEGGRGPLPVEEEVVVYRPGMTMDEVEREAIQLALKGVGGNRRKAAEQLGIGERTLYRKIKSFGLEE